MTFIILDMEWDSAYYKEEKRFINQILQIGAVKLNDKCEITDTFEVTVKSKISNRVSGRFSALTGITSDMMRNGLEFEDAVKQYNEWLGEDTVTMTWSNSDLYAILENESSLLKDIRFKIENYLDLQSYIQNEMRLAGFEVNTQISLLNAALMLNVPFDNLSLHTAKDDSLLCAAILKNNYNKERFYSRIRPADEEFFKRLTFKPYFIDDISNELIDNDELIFNCSKCGNKMTRTSKWRFKNRWFSAKFLCKNCTKKFLCKVSFKKTFDDLVVKKKVVENKQNEVQSVSESV